MNITEGMKSELKILEKELNKERFSKGMRNRFYLFNEFNSIVSHYYTNEQLERLTNAIADRTFKRIFDYMPINERMQALKTICLHELVTIIIYILGTQKYGRDTEYFSVVGCISIIASQISKQLKQVEYLLSDEDTFHLAGDVLSAFDNSIIVIFKEKEKKQWVIKRRPTMTKIYEDYTNIVENTIFQLPSRSKRPTKVLNNFMNGQATGGSLLIGNKFTKHPHKLNYKVINHLNRTPMCIDRVAFGEWGLAKQYDLPEGLEKAYSNRLYKELTKSVDKLLGLVFYNSYAYDSRGRIYTIEYLANHQQHESSRCMLNIANNNEKLTTKGVYFLKTTIVNYLEPILDDNTNVAKLHPDDRVKWFDKVTTDKSNTYIGTADLREYLTNADKPKMALRAIIWFEEYADNPDKPIEALAEVDASASGLQVLSVASKDINGMKITNVLKNKNNTYNDPYVVIYDRFNKAVDKDLDIKRKNLKLSIMITFYGGSLLPKRIFGEYYDTFMATLNQEFPRVIKAFNIIENLTANKEGYFMYWMPDGHLVKVPAIAISDIRVSLAHLNSSSRMKFPMLDPFGKRVGLIANITHSIDAFIMRTVLIRCKATGIRTLPLHDAWLVHPNHLATIQKFYVDALQEVIDKSVLHGILTQLQNKNIDPNKPFEYYRRETEIKVDNYLGIT